VYYGTIYWVNSKRRDYIKEKVYMSVDTSIQVAVSLKTISMYKYEDFMYDIADIPIKEVGGLL